MPQVLVLGKYYPPFSGGIEVNTRDVSEALAKGHDVTVYCFNHEPGTKVEKINGVKVKRFGMLANVKSQPLSLAMIFEIAQANPDIVHFHAPNFVANAGLCLMLLMGKRPKIVITHHTDIFGRKTLKNLLMPLYRFVLNRSTFVIVTSGKIIEISDELHEGPNYRVIPLGINPAQFAVETLEAPDPRAKPIGFLGRHARYKGLGVMLKALSKLPGVRARIAGDGPYRAEAEELADSLNVKDRADFVGDIRNMQDKIEFYKSIGVFVFPSTEVTETFGISQLEAMLMGVPVVASNLRTGVTDVAIHEETALLIEPGNSEQLTAAIARLQEDEDLRERLTANAREHVLTRFTHDVIIRQTTELFDEALADKKTLADVA